MKKLFAGLALAALALASVPSADAQVSLNLNAPAVDGTNSGTINSATLNAAYTLPLNGGQNTVAFSLSGLTASGGTVVVEGTVDGVNWFGLNSAQGGSGALQQAFTADGTFLVNVASRSAVRIRVSAVGSGNITVTSITSIAQRDMGIDKPLPAGSNSIGGVTVSAQRLTPTDIGGYVGSAGATISNVAQASAFTLQTAPVNGSLQIGDFINTTNFAAGTTITGLTSGTANTAGAVYSTSAPAANAAGSGSALQTYGARTLTGANLNRSFWKLQNNGPATCSFNFLVNATGSGVRDFLLPAGSYVPSEISNVETGALSVFCNAPSPVAGRQG